MAFVPVTIVDEGAVPNTVGDLAEGEIAAFNTDEEAREYIAAEAGGFAHLDTFDVLELPAEGVELLSSTIRVLARLTRNGADWC